MSGRRVLLAGAGGYVGGRPLPLLERKGLRVRCLARRPEALGPRVGRGTEVVRSDVLDPPSLEAALEGVETAYYFVHSMGAGEDFEDKDRRGARNFAEAARRCGVRRIIYLGGLGRGDGLSAHLKGRQEVGRLLAESGVPTIELRASIIIGSGSLSFEMMRALVERLPVMITPRWVRLRAQPRAVEDLLAYLLEALVLPDGAGGVYEIGGRDAVSYEDILLEYARQRGLRRMLVPVPLLTPRLSSLWLGFVTPVYARVGRRFFTSLRNSTVVEDERALAVFSIQPRGRADAIGRVLSTERLLWRGSLRSGLPSWPSPNREGWSRSDWKRRPSPSFAGWPLNAG